MEVNEYTLSFPVGLEIDWLSIYYCTTPVKIWEFLDIFFAFEVRRLYLTVK